MSWNLACQGISNPASLPSQCVVTRKDYHGHWYVKISVGWDKGSGKITTLGAPAAKIAHRHSIWLSTCTYLNLFIPRDVETSIECCTGVMHYMDISCTFSQYLIGKYQSISVNKTKNKISDGIDDTLKWTWAHCCYNKTVMHLQEVWICQHFHIVLHFRSQWDMVFVISFSVKATEHKDSSSKM